MLCIPTWLHNEENSRCVNRHGCIMERSALKDLLCAALTVMTALSIDLVLGRHPPGPGRLDVLTALNVLTAPPHRSPRSAVLTSCVERADRIYRVFFPEYSFSEFPF